MPDEKVDYCFINGNQMPDVVYVGCVDPDYPAEQDMIRYIPERTCFVRKNVSSVEGNGFGTCDLVDKCSECGEIFYLHPWRGRVLPNYCPSCGAKVMG